MVTPRDFVALVVWIVCVPALKLLLDRYWPAASVMDLVFLAVSLLIVLQLVWLRIGYPPP